MKSVSLVVLSSLACTSAALADLVGSGSATLSFDLPTITTITPLSGLNASFGVTETAIASARQPSLVWALERGSRSGRVAYQFARDWAGRDHGSDATPAVVAEYTAPDGLDRV